MTRPVAIPGATFEAEVLKAEAPVLVDFWAAWCAPCRAIAPVVDEVAREYAGRLKVVKVDVDADSEIATSYNVQGIPTLLLIRGAMVVGRVVGLVPKAVIQRQIEQALASGMEGAKAPAGRDGPQ